MSAVSSAFAFQSGATRTVAVADFDAKNCASTISFSISRKIEASLQKVLASKGFVFADESKVKSIQFSGPTLGESSRYEKSSDDAPDIIISGRVEGASDNRGDNARSKYWISARIISAHGEISATNFVTEWCTPALFDRVASEMAMKITEYVDAKYKEKERNAYNKAMLKPAIDVDEYPYLIAGMKKPFGSFSSITHIGFGGAVGLGINNASIPYLGLDRIVFRGEIGYFRFLPSHGSASIDMFTITGGTGYAFGSPSRCIVPRIDLGYQIRLIGNSDYEDPMLNFALEGYVKYGKIFVMIVPSYTVYFDNKKTGTMMGISAGIGYNF